MNAYGTNSTKVEEVLTRMKKARVKPDVTTYTTLMNSYGTNHIEAEKVLKRMKIDKVTPDVATYNTLMKAYGANHVEVENVFNRMKEAEIQPNEVTEKIRTNACRTNVTNATKVGEESAEGKNDTTCNVDTKSDMRGTMQADNTVSMTSVTNINETKKATRRRRRRKKKKRKSKTKKETREGLICLGIHHFILFGVLLLCFSLFLYYAYFL